MLVTPGIRPLCPVSRATPNTHARMRSNAIASSAANPASSATTCLIMASSCGLPDCAFSTLMREKAISKASGSSRMAASKPRLSSGPRHTEKVAPALCVQ